MPARQRTPPSQKSSSRDGGPTTPGQHGTLVALVNVVQRLLRSNEAAEVILGALEGIAALSGYEYALLELIPGFGQSGAPTVFRATPESIEAVSPSSILVEERSVLFPLQSGGRELGRLRVVPRGDELTEEEELGLKALAAYMALALRLAEVETEAQRRKAPVTRSDPVVIARRVRAGNLKAELSQILSAQLGPVVLSERILDRLLNSLEVDAGAIFIYDDRTNELTRSAQRGVPGPLPARLTIAQAAATVLGRATAAGAPHLVRDMFDVPLLSDEDKVLRTWGFHTLLCYPLLAGKRVTGAIQLMSRRSNALSSESLTLFGETSDELALALQNAVRFERLSTMAVTDSLTGLHNRRFCEEYVRKQLTAAQRVKRGCGFLLLDIDHFKRYNDQFGHAAGDAVLREVAARVLASIRAADLAGRYGGEEFMVALPSADLATTAAVAERIRMNVQQIVPPTGATDTPVTVSVGVSCYPECARDLPSLFASADAALYAAKDAGRNCLVTAPLLPASGKPADPAGT